MSRPTRPDPGNADSNDSNDTSTDAVVEAVLDARGLRCPLPVIRLARLVGENPGVREVTVLATDPAATHDIPAWCRMRGHRYLGAQDCDGHTAHRVGVRPTAPATGP